MQFVTEGLVLRERTVGESDRLLDILTKDRGVIHAFARRAKNMKDPKHAATGLLTYSRMKISQGKDKYMVNEAFPKEVFFGLREDILRLSLGQYFCELSLELVPEGTPSAEYLRLLLNALYFLSKGLRPLGQIKAIVELRMLSDAGFMPDLVGCGECGHFEAQRVYFRLHRGQFYCEKCYYPKPEDPCIEISFAALTAMRHIIYADFEKIFSFNLTPSALWELETTVEAYLTHIIQKRIKTLEFYHSLLPDTAGRGE